jgi:hypothetical protein
MRTLVSTWPTRSTPGPLRAIPVITPCVLPDRFDSIRWACAASVGLAEERSVWGDDNGICAKNEGPRVLPGDVGSLGGREVLGHLCRGQLSRVNPFVNVGRAGVEDEPRVARS